MEGPELERIQKIALERGDKLIECNDALFAAKQRIAELEAERDKFTEIADIARNASCGDIDSYLYGETDGEVAKLKASLAYTAACLEREMSLRDEAHKAGWEACRAAAVECVPTNWLHPSLSHMLGGRPLTNSDVEAAMRSIAQAIATMEYEND